MAGLGAWGCPSQSEEGLMGARNDTQGKAWLTHTSLTRGRGGAEGRWGDLPKMLSIGEGGGGVPSNPYRDGVCTARRLKQ